MRESLRPLFVTFVLLLFVFVARNVAGQENPEARPLTENASLPSAASESIISATLGRDLLEYHVHLQGATFSAENAGQRLSLNFSSTGLEVHTAEASWKLALRGYGRADELKQVDSVVPQVSDNRVEYRRGLLTEWYVNGPFGVEQGFILKEPPSRSHRLGLRAATEPLILALAFDGDLTASVDRSGKCLVLADSKGQSQLRYGELWASDASGRQLRSWMEIEHGQLLLKVEDNGARYPMVIDPFVQRAKLSASDAAKLDFAGASVAISSDGNTAVVGMASTRLPGAVYVFVKPATGWTNMTQTAKLTASDGAINDYLGYSVTVSGNTVMAGAPNAHGNQGAAYIFARPASGWTNMTETAELTASDTHRTLGSSVAISGNTAVAGSPDQNISQPGAAYVFVKPTSGWTSMTQTAELTPSDGHTYDGFGSSVAISGNTVVAGTIGRTKAYVFVEPSSGWANMTQTAWLTLSQGSSSFSVGISGNTAVIGSPYATVGSNYAQGAAYIFVEPTTGWANMTPTATLTASDGTANDSLGYGVAISGNLVVTGAPFAHIGANASQGAAYTFTKPITGWKSTSHFTAKLTASDGAQNDTLGWSVFANGNTLLIGAPGASSQQGAAYIFGQ